MNSFCKTRFPLEGCIWLTGLCYLYCFGNGNNSFSLCLFALLGIDFCPGCGIGHALYHLMHGEFSVAWQAHPFSFLALPLLTLRIAQDFYLYFSYKPLKYHEQKFIDLPS